MRKPIRISEVRKVNGDKVMLMFRQHITTPNNAASTLTSLANKSDSRFSQSERPAILSGEAVDLIEMFPELEQTITAVNNATVVGTKEEVNLVVEDFRGEELNIQVIENTIQDAKRPTQEPKRRGAEGSIMRSNGEPIYSHTSIVVGEPNHVFLEADPETTNAAASLVGSTTSSVESMGDAQ